MRDEKYMDNYRGIPDIRENIAVLLRWSNIATKNGPPAWFLISINNYSRYLRWVVKINWVRWKHDGENAKRRYARICINRSRRESRSLTNCSLDTRPDRPRLLFINEDSITKEKIWFALDDWSALALTNFGVLLHVTPGLFDTLASA